MNFTSKIYASEGLREEIIMYKITVMNDVNKLR